MADRPPGPAASSAWSLPIVDAGVGAAGDVDNLVAVLELDGGAVATVDLSRNARFGDDVRTEVLGSAGRGVRRPAADGTGARSGRPTACTSWPARRRTTRWPPAWPGRRGRSPPRSAAVPSTCPAPTASARATRDRQAVIEAARTGRRSGGGTVTRRVVIHQDDVGMCHGANVAFVELSPCGAVTSGSVMVPCPWFTEIAEQAAADAGARPRRAPHADVGEGALPLAADQPARRRRPGSTDASGYLWRDVAERPPPRRSRPPSRWSCGRRSSAALAAGIDVTHLDAHMGTALAPEFCAIYVQLGVDHRLPVLLTGTLGGIRAEQPPRRRHRGRVRARSSSARARRRPADLRRGARDAVGPAPDEPPAPPTALFADVPDGLTFLALHPNAPASWRRSSRTTAHIRTAEYELLRSDDSAALLGPDVERVGMRALRDAVRRLSGRFPAIVTAENA